MNFAVKLKLEPVMGVDVADALAQMVAVSNRLDLAVSMTVNGVYLFCTPGAKPSDLQEWHDRERSVCRK